MDKEKDNQNDINLTNFELPASISAVMQATNTMNAVSAVTKRMTSFGNSFSEASKISQGFKNFVQISQIPDLYIPKIDCIAQRIRGFNDKINQAIANMDEICSILARYDYLLPLDLPLNSHSYLLNVLKNTSEECREKEIDKIMLKIFSYKKWEIVSDIIEQLSKNKKVNPKRIIILQDCVKVLKRSSRKIAGNVILPTLIAQIEGIWVDILGCSTSKKQKLDSAVNEMKNSHYSTPAKNLLTDVLFQYTKASLPAKSEFCRNKILHGEEVDYGSINNVIRAFLIIEFLDSIKTKKEIEENFSCH